MASLACCVCDWSSNILAICFPVAQRREQPWWKHQGYFGYICKPKDKDGQRAEARHEKARQNVLILQSAWMLMMQTASCSTPCKFLSPRLLSYMLCAAAELPCYLLSKCNFCSLITQYYIHKSLVELLTFNSNANLSVCETVMNWHLIAYLRLTLWSVFRWQDEQTSVFCPTLLCTPGLLAVKEH